MNKTSHHLAHHLMFGPLFMVENKLSGQREINKWPQTSVNIKQGVNIWMLVITDLQYCILAKGYRYVRNLEFNRGKWTVTFLFGNNLEKVKHLQRGGESSFSTQKEKRWIYARKELSWFLQNLEHKRNNFKQSKTGTNWKKPIRKKRFSRHSIVTVLGSTYSFKRLN